jgi:lipopolysaccharide biosynthesis regulator YciM
LQAQRISPQAAQSYVILAQIAQKQRNYNHAEALLQRGLSLANDNATKKQLWLIRLEIAQTQHNPNAIQQAKRALQQL